MSQGSKIILVALVAAILGGALVYFWQEMTQEQLPTATVQEQELNEPESRPAIVVTESEESEWTELVQYNCELSDGTFDNNVCTCPLEGEQTQEDMYDESTGYCQSSMGGPAGDAFSASIGLPWGPYAFFMGIIVNSCEESGGSMSGAACICSEGTTYDKTTGTCN